MDTGEFQECQEGEGEAAMGLYYCNDLAFSGMSRNPLSHLTVEKWDTIYTYSGMDHLA